MPGSAPDTVLLCYSACPDPASARTIADALVEERLAACVNQLPGVHSTYRWQDVVTRDDEVLLLIKTTRSRLQALRRRLLELHPYELPELIAVPVHHGHPAYLDWVRQGVTARRPAAGP
ncbi:MAG: divalent-cation tolerance protein CutA [Pseudomonadota bacterium]|nr:divalent-cation tolerance protein CutA [Xanthomonadaceae bacterium]MDE2247188.1 divalent-cation tolerance protein CutA [Xanthomonadaceae bacterium]MDE3209994.1 divalent-cation tolerance protein CutA [Pseudomonadota bacterium]